MVMGLPTSLAEGTWGRSARSFPGLAVALVWVALAMLSAACGGGTANLATASPETGAEAPLKVDASTLKLLQTPTKAFQLSLVEHGELTFTAYDRLAHAYMQCVSDGGARLQDSEIMAGGSYSFEVYTPPDPSGKVSAAVGACTDQFYDPLMPDWSLEHQAPRAAIEAGNAALAECLRASGITIESEHPGALDFQKIEAVGGKLDPRFIACSQKVTHELKLGPGFSGG